MELPQELYENRSDPTDGPTYWDTNAVHKALLKSHPDQSLRTTERTLETSGLLPSTLKLAELRDESDLAPRNLVVENLEAQAKRKRYLSFIVQEKRSEAGTVLFANDGRQGRRWVFLKEQYTDEDLLNALKLLAGQKNLLVWPHGEVTARFRQLAARSHDFKDDVRTIRIGTVAYHDPGIATTILHDDPNRHRPGTDMTHLDRLEAESMHIIREVVAQADNPVMLYSVGKDSSVMLHLARKAFYPSPPPFPLMHVDTRWKFQAMYQFRDRIAEDIGMDLIVHINPEGVEKDINPFDHGSQLHTDVMKTQGLKQALDQYKFDVAFGGARRDEEKSRAKERVFSFRTSAHRWDPKSQRPELWNLYNGYKAKGDSIRVFPLSNWTELDIWQYIYREHIPIVPLYYAAERPVVERDGMLMMVDDDRMRLQKDEDIQVRRVRFRTLGCYPLTGAIDSEADDLSSIVLELLESRTSERQGRAIDADTAGSMEKKKQEGYF